MTKEEHKVTIVQQLQQQSLNVLIDSLAAALAEIEQLKIKAEPAKECSRAGAGAGAGL
jgi:hypothetical protein